MPFYSNCEKLHGLNSNSYSLVHHVMNYNIHDRSEMIVGFSIAAGSGVFAALASVFSKVALEDGGTLIRATICPWMQDEYCNMVFNQLKQC